MKVMLNKTIPKIKGTASIEIKSNVQHPGSAFYGRLKGHGFFFYNPFLEEIVRSKTIQFI